MAGEDGGRPRVCWIVAVVLLLCSLAPSSTCFSVRELSKKVEQANEAVAMVEMIGSILFNGKELNFQSGSVSTAATGNEGLLRVDQSDGAKSLLAQTVQPEDDMVIEAAWRSLNVSLHCGQNKMELKATGLGAADLQLDTGNAHTLPLSQVPETCGYSMQLKAAGLVLIIPYDGCNVIQENGTYVVPMSWLETPVKFVCPVSPNPDATPTSSTPESVQQPRKVPFPDRPWSPHRSKRQIKYPPPFCDPSQAYYNNLCIYYTSLLKPTQTIATKISPQVRPPAYPSNMYYPYSLFQPYYYYTYPPAGKPSPGVPENSEMYYYPVDQNYYVKPSYPQYPKDPVQATLPPPTTVKPTSAPTTQTTKKCPSVTPPSGSPYPGQMSYVNYYDFPFIPHVSYGKAGKVPNDQKYMPEEADYKSGLHAQALPDFHF